MDKNSKGNKRFILILGFALFSMFFGAGNLIFPPSLGRISGDMYFLAILGFIITAAGLPFLGILAVSQADGGIDKIASKVHPNFGKFLLIVILLIIGPMLAIPRTCATTYELGVIPNAPWLGSWTFSGIFFAIVLYFSLNPKKVVKRIGKILTPILLLALTSLILTGIFLPIGSPADLGVGIKIFGTSFTEGYQTMDMLAATIFGIIILNELKNKNITDRKTQMSMIVKAGGIAIIGLAVIYAGLLYLGSSTTSIAGDFTRTSLLTSIATMLLGKAGASTLGIAVSMACLTTAIALTVCCAQYFSKMTNNKLSYRNICFIVSGISLFISNAGVELIIKFAVPPLVTLYPVVMVLVIMTIFNKHLKDRPLWIATTLGAFIFGLLETAMALGINKQVLTQVYSALPLSNYGLGWILPCVFFGIIGSTFNVYRKKNVLVIHSLQNDLEATLFNDTKEIFKINISPLIFNDSSQANDTIQYLYLKSTLIKKLKKLEVDFKSIDSITIDHRITADSHPWVHQFADTFLEKVDKETLGLNKEIISMNVILDIAEEIKVNTYVLNTSL
ncbi:MAG: branched-chain amino acid transport system II carrier protein [Pseudomonadota bacterium]